MRYCGPMRYAVQFPAYRLGGQMELCVIRGYALSEVCVKRGSTVFHRAFVLSWTLRITSPVDISVVYLFKLLLCRPNLLRQ